MKQTQALTQQNCILLVLYFTVFWLDVTIVQLNEVHCASQSV
jgi:hypothetical protein